jgi:hypothetical protein
MTLAPRGVRETRPRRFVVDVVVDQHLVEDQNLMFRRDFALLGEQELELFHVLLLQPGLKTFSSLPSAFREGSAVAIVPF